MAVGDLINYSNYKALDGSSWRSSSTVGSSAGTFIFYVSAPAFYVTFYIQGAWPWAYQEGSLNVYPYDPETGKFGSAVYTGSGSVRGDNRTTWSFTHNKDGGSSKDVHDCQLWKIQIYHGDNAATASASGSLYVGGLGLCTEDIYNTYFKGRHIYCSKGAFWRKGSGSNQYASDEAFLQAQGYSCMRGTQISISTGTYKYITANHLTA